jgi:hypothetical protein
VHVILKLRSYFSVTLLLLLSACGGGGSSSRGDGENPDTDSPDSGTPTDSSSGESNHYLFYSDGLIAIDPDRPETPITIEAGSDIVGKSDTGNNPLIRYFNTGRHDNTINAITDFLPHSLIYAKIDGHLYKVSARQDGSLTPRQVSSENAAERICSMWNVSDFNDIEQSQLVYDFPGPDNSCLPSTDNTWKMIRLGMGTSETPIEAMRPLVWLLDSDSSISGWLVNDSGELRRCDENFSNCGESLARIITSARVIYPETFPVYGGPLGLNNHMFEIDRQLFIYQGDTDELSNSIYTIPQNEYFIGYVTDQHYIYFAGFSTIYRTPIDGSSTAVVLAEEAQALESTPVIWGLSATENRLVYAYSSSSQGEDTEIRAVDKTGGVPVTLVTTAGANQGSAAVRDGRIYYSLETFNRPNGVSGLERIPLLAGIMDENGGVQFEAANAAWVGATYSTILTYERGSEPSWAIDKMLLGQSTDGEISGMSLQAFDRLSGNQQHDLGTVPDVEGLVEFFCQYSPTPDDILCFATIETSVQPWSAQREIFYLDVSKSSSPIKVTDTPDVSESIIIR